VLIEIFIAKNNTGWTCWAEFECATSGS